MPTRGIGVVGDLALGFLDLLLGALLEWGGCASIHLYTTGVAVATVVYRAPLGC